VTQMDKLRPRIERKEPPLEKKEPLLARIRSFIDRKPRRVDKISPLEGRKKNPLEGKTKLIIAVLGVILLAAIVVIAATATYKSVSGNAVATPTPEPTATPEPTPEATPIPTATPDPTPTITATPGPVISVDGPFYMHTSLNRADGKCLVSLQLPKGADAVEVSKLSIDITCEGQTYGNVWKPKLMDWCNADNDTLLEKEEIIAAVIDTPGKNIPQGTPLTLLVMNEGTEVQRLTVAPA